jgi:Protein of unknown function (DUF4058)
MKSPFPGMDPYIEACGLWEGFHSHLIEAVYRQVAPLLPRGYTADTATRSYVVVVESEGKDEKLAKADVTVTQREGEKKTRKKKGGLAVVESAESEDSVPMQAFIAEEFKESSVEIYADLEDRVLVTCIEVLSPSNKRKGTVGCQVYERKRQALLLGEANFIEIDLLRGGTRMPMITPWPDSPYTLLVSRSSRAPRCRAWRSYFHRPLPVIPVPLLSPDPDLRLDLQPLLEEIYSLARYDERIHYAAPLAPPLSEADAVCVRELLGGRKPGS